MEYMDKGEINWQNENQEPFLSEDVSRNIFQDILLGVEYCKISTLLN